MTMHRESPVRRLLPMANDRLEGPNFNQLVEEIELTVRLLLRFILPVFLIYRGIRVWVMI